MNIINHKTIEERLEFYFQKSVVEIIPDTQLHEYEWGKPVGEELN